MSNKKSIAQINKQIESLARRGQRLDADFQATGIDVLEHFSQHRDIGLVNRLYLAVPNGGRKTAMASWLLAHAAIKANSDVKTKREMPFVNDKTKANTPDAARLDMWYNHKPEKAPDQVFDLQKAVKAVISRAKAAKSIKNGDKAMLELLATAVNLNE